MNLSIQSKSPDVGQNAYVGINQCISHFISYDFFCFYFDLDLGLSPGPHYCKIGDIQSAFQWGPQFLKMPISLFKAIYELAG